MSEATKLSGTTLNSEADPKGEGLEARSNRTDPDVVQFTVFIAPYRLRRVLMSEANRTDPDAVQFTVFIAPYRLRRVLMSEANRTDPDVVQFTVFIAPCTPERQFASSCHARRVQAASGGR